MRLDFGTVKMHDGPTTIHEEEENEEEQTS